MMHLVMECSQREATFVFDKQAFKSGMAGGRRQRLMLHMKQNVNRVRRYNPVDKDRREKQCMLDWMHGKARPGANICIPVM